MPAVYRTQDTSILDDQNAAHHAGYNKVKPLDDLISDIMMRKMERTQQAGNKSRIRNGTYNTSPSAAGRRTGGSVTAGRISARRN